MNIFFVTRFMNILMHGNYFSFFLQFQEQASLLLAKVQFCQGFYSVALATLEKIDLASIALRESDGNSLRNTRLLLIVAESYAIKGMPQ